VLQTVVAHRAANGAVRYYSVLARDITERYAIEQMKHEFVSNVTHELRSPLTGILGYLDLLLEEAFGDVTDEVRGALGEVRGSATQLLELINDLLALWRTEDRSAGASEEVDLESIIHAAARSISPIAIGKRIDLEVSTEAVTCVGDRKQLERAFVNVISNAVKFTPVGGRVTVSAAAEVGIAVARITDTGVGIPDAELGSIFERFYRASTAEDADIPGTGLGLPLVKQTIESHGGSVCVESEVGLGTTFHITLPALIKARALPV
jgi:signal transduction histidine kinase